MSYQDYRKKSREAWGTNNEGNLNQEQLRLGALLRIADATEVMAKNHQSLISERDMYKRWNDEKNRTIDHLNRRIAALQGVITKMKKGAK